MASEQESNFQVYIRIKPFNHRDAPPFSEIEPETSPKISPSNSNKKTQGSNTPLKNPRSPRFLSKSPTRQVYDAIWYDSTNIQVVDQDSRIADRRERSFQFDGVFGQNTSNETVFKEAVLPNLDGVLEGYNTTIMAYGITGAGKTHTIFGESTKLHKEKGICSSTLENLLDRMRDSTSSLKCYHLFFSYLEIYNEQVIDLLSDSSKPLQILDDPQKGVMVLDLVEHQVTKREELTELIARGNTKRTLASTSINQFSSRSHAMLQIRVEIRNKLGNTYGGECLQSKAKIIDLAGSEKTYIYDTKTNEKNLLEGANINRSLLALGNCINLLSNKNRKGGFVPYRDSKLTRLLKDSLGGNTRTIMIGCITPNSYFLEETISTLNYASRARNIKKRIERNIKDQDLSAMKYIEVIGELKMEVETLKEVIGQQNSCSRCFTTFKQLTHQKNPSSHQLLFNQNSIEKFLDNANEREPSHVFEERKARYEQEINSLHARINEQKEGLKRFSDLSETREKISFLEKFLAEYASNYEEQTEIRQSIRELDEILGKGEQELAALRDQLAHPKTSPQIKAGFQRQIERVVQQIKANMTIKQQLLQAYKVNQEQQSILQNHHKKIIEDYLIHIYRLDLKTIELRSEMTENKLIMFLYLQESQKKQQNLTILQAKYAKLEEDYNSMKEQFIHKELQVNELQSTIRSFNSTAASQAAINKSNNILNEPKILTDDRLQDILTSQSYSRPRLTSTLNNLGEKSPKIGEQGFGKNSGLGAHTIRSKSVANDAIKDHSEVVVTPKIDKQRRSPHSEMGVNTNSNTKFWLDDKYKSPSSIISANKKQKPKSNDNISAYNSNNKSSTEVETKSINNLHSKSNKSPRTYEHLKSIADVSKSKSTPVATIALFDTKRNSESLEQSFSTNKRLSGAMNTSSRYSEQMKDFLDEARIDEDSEQNLTSQQQQSASYLKSIIFSQEAAADEQKSSKTNTHETFHLGDSQQFMIELGSPKMKQGFLNIENHSKTISEHYQSMASSQLKENFHNNTLVDQSESVRIDNDLNRSSCDFTNILSPPIKEAKEELQAFKSKGNAILVESYYQNPSSRAVSDSSCDLQYNPLDSVEANQLRRQQDKWILHSDIDAENCTFNENNFSPSELMSEHSITQSNGLNGKQVLQDVTNNYSSIRSNTLGSMKSDYSLNNRSDLPYTSNSYGNLFESKGIDHSQKFNEIYYSNKALSAKDKLLQSGSINPMETENEEGEDSEVVDFEASQIGSPVLNKTSRMLYTGSFPTQNNAFKRQNRPTIDLDDLPDY